jgi:hypothetical protein
MTDFVSGATPTRELLSKAIVTVMGPRPRTSSLLTLLNDGLERDVAGRACQPRTLL